MLFVVLLAQQLLLLAVCEARGGSDKNCKGRGYCVQWLNLSSNPHASYNHETGEWSCTYGQTAVGEIDCTNQTWHETCRDVYVSPVTLDTPTHVILTPTIATGTKLGNVTASLKPRQRKECRWRGCGTL